MRSRRRGRGLRVCGVERTVAASKDDGVRGASSSWVRSTTRCDRADLGGSPASRLRRTRERARSSPAHLPARLPRRGSRTSSRSSASPGSGIPPRPRSSTASPQRRTLLRRRYRAGCLAYGDGITYWALGESSASTSRSGRCVKAPTRGSARSQGRARYSARPWGLDVAPDLHPLDAREQLHTAAVAFVEELASERPAVLLVEDIHWAEPDLLDLLERAVSDARGPILLIGTARPELFEKRQVWGAGRRNTTVLWLDPLTACEVSLDARGDAACGPARRSSRSRWCRGPAATPSSSRSSSGSSPTAAFSSRGADGWAVGEREVELLDARHGACSARGADRSSPRRSRRRPSRRARSSGESSGRRPSSICLAAACRTSRSSRIAT